MEHSELIHRFIDEGLDPINEQKLFESMANNPALRSEFKQYLSFERAVLTDFSAFQPSMDATNAIFSNLGISTLTANTSATTATGLSFWAKYSGLIFTNVASVIITAVLFYFLNTQNSDNNNFSASKGNFTKQSTEQLNPFPTISNNELQNNQQANYPVPEKIKYVYVQKKNESLTNNNQQPSTIDEKENKSPIEINQVSIAKLDKQNLENPLFQNQIFNQLENLQSVNNFQILPFEYTIKSFGLDNISIMFNGNDSYSLPQSPLPRSSQPLFDSKSFVVFYDFNPSFALGLDVRQEFYYLDYTGQIESKDFRYEQNTNFTSLGIVGKWNWLKYNNFKTFANLYIGGNKVGQIGRFMVGTEISPSKEYGFIIGVEGSLLRHLHQNKDFYAKKIGLNYGIIFHF